MKTKNLLKIYFIRKPNLNSVVVTGSGLYEKQGKENKGLSIHAVQAIHIAFTLVRIRVNLAVNKEARLEKRT